MKGFVAAAALSILAGCASTGDQFAGVGGPPRYDCYTYVREDHVLTLPFPKEDAATEAVYVTLHGDRLPALYQRQGLTHFWALDKDLYIEVGPDLAGRYMNFQGAEEGEKRKPEAVFKCVKRG